MKKIVLRTVLTTLSLTSFASISSASPVPTHTCAVPSGTVLQRDGYSLGENLYVFDNSVALEAYQDPKDQLPLKEANGAITYFSDGQITVATFPDGGQIELPDGQIFSCTAYKDDGLSEGADGLAYSSITRAEPNADGARLQKLGDGEEIFISENMGNNYQGFDWFEIEYNKGKNGYMSEAFVWGGTICSAGYQVSGLSSECP